MYRQRHMDTERREQTETHRYRQTGHTETREHKQKHRYRETETFRDTQIRIEGDIQRYMDTDITGHTDNIDTERREYTETQRHRQTWTETHRYRETGIYRDTWTETDMNKQRHMDTDRYEQRHIDTERREYAETHGHRQTGT